MAAPAIAERLLTAEEFALSPNDPEDRRQELLDGRVITMSHPVESHSNSAWAILRSLDRFADEHDLGRVRNDVGFILRRDPDRVVSPDAAFISHARLPEDRDQDRFFPVSPDLAVEVKSEHDTNAELLTKAAEYLAAGSLRVWLVRPDQRTVIVFSTDGDVRTLRVVDTLTSADAGFAVEGFALAVAEIFESE